MWWQVLRQLKWELFCENQWCGKCNANIILGAQFIQGRSESSIGKTLLHEKSLTFNLNLWRRSCFRKFKQVNRKIYRQWNRTILNGNPAENLSDNILRINITHLLQMKQRYCTWQSTVKLQASFTCSRLNRVQILSLG